MSGYDFYMLIEDYRMDMQIPGNRISHKNKYIIEKYVLTNWAIDELNNYVYSNLDMDLATAIESFRKKMVHYYKKYQHKEIFFIASEVAEDIADILRISGNVER